MQIPRNPQLAYAAQKLNEALSLASLLSPIPPWGQAVIAAMQMIVKHQAAKVDLVGGAEPDLTSTDI